MGLVMFSSHPIPLKVLGIMGLVDFRAEHFLSKGSSMTHRFSLSGFTSCMSHFYDGLKTHMNQTSDSFASQIDSDMNGH